MITKIPRKSKILSISHCDFDGVCCQIVLGNVFPNIEYRTSEFYRIDQLMSDVDYSLYDFVFITDIYPTDPNLLNKDNIILIDHHPSSHNNPKLNRFVISDKNKSATALVNQYVTKMYPSIDLSHLDRLTALVTDYDIWIKRFPLSTFINELLWNVYDVDAFRERFIKGDVKLTIDEIKFIRNQKDKFADVFNEVTVCDFDKIKGCVLLAEEFINEIASKLLNEYGYNLVIVRHPVKDRASLRSNLDGIKLGKVLSELGYGGGHDKAAGLFEKNLDKFKEKLLYLEAKLYKEYPDIRRTDV